MAAKGYKTVGKFGESEIIINKSRFIGACKRCETEDEALDFIKERRLLHKGANHNCYAYIIGKNSGIMRYSDDGEPGGTAGLPIIEVLKSKGLVDCAVVVTRYFGGVLLGAGGLVRAYTQGCVIGVEAAGELAMEPCFDYMLSLPYPLLGRFENAMKETPLKVLEKEFGADVTLSLRMPEEYESEFLLMMSEMTSGNADLLKTGEGFFPL
jgi:uncharacterized YigZ family protein